MHYEIPGEDFPQNDPQPKHDPALEGRRLISEAIKYMRSLHEQGYSIPEIAKMVPDHIDGSGWAESSITHVDQPHAPELQRCVEVYVAAMIEAGAQGERTKVCSWVPLLLGAAGRSRTAAAAPCTMNVPERKQPYVRARLKRVFLARLAECGQVLKAGEAAGVDASNLYKERKRDKEFGQEWEEAIDIAMYGAETELRRRAVEGVDTPIYQGGKLVDTVKRYSDVLLMFMLKAHNPAKYRDNYRADGDAQGTDFDAWADDTETEE